MPGGETANQVLDRYLPVLTELRTRYLDDDDWTSDIVVVSHGAAIRLTAAVLADVDSSFALDHHLANTEAVVLTAGRRRALELRAVGNPDAAVRLRCRTPRRWPTRWSQAPTRWADGASMCAQSQPTASQSTTNVCGSSSGPAQPSSVHSEPVQPMANERAVAVLQACPAFAAAGVHSWPVLSTASRDRSPDAAPGLSPAARAGPHRRRARPSPVRAAGRRRCRSGGRSRASR